ncbi:hypothetical protein DSECCO2_506160 [anaerobic digester metagenome]|uniref:Uncharacterized protein n=1 Tax=Sedimentibacter saalensis TaxID=130788 RepID=A0A562JLN5_9FIRM|nr:hypothetical protein [Sedimentibacter saalensis]TWH83704.1 hypothetical protein LY60_00316 [Sedimentibacter saalensis]
MNNESNKKIERKNKEENKNAFNDIKMFLYLLLCSEFFMLYLSGRQMFYENVDCSPAVAGINTVLLILTILHIRKIKTSKK